MRNVLSAAEHRTTRGRATSAWSIRKRCTTARRYERRLHLSHDLSRPFRSSRRLRRMCSTGTMPRAADVRCKPHVHATRSSPRNISPPIRALEASGDVLEHDQRMILVLGKAAGAACGRAGDCGRVGREADRRSPWRGTIIDANFRRRHRPSDAGGPELASAGTTSFARSSARLGSPRTLIVTDRRIACVTRASCSPRGTPPALKSAAQCGFCDQSHLNQCLQGPRRHDARRLRARLGLHALSALLSNTRRPPVGYLSWSSERMIERIGIQCPTTASSEFRAGAT